GGERSGELQPWWSVRSSSLAPRLSGIYRVMVNDCPLQLATDDLRSVIVSSPHAEQHCRPEKREAEHEVSDHFVAEERHRRHIARAQASQRHGIHVAEEQPHSKVADQEERNRRGERCPSNAPGPELPFKNYAAQEENRRVPGPIDKRVVRERIRINELGKDHVG